VQICGWSFELEFQVGVVEWTFYHSFLELKLLLVVKLLSLLGDLESWRYGGVPILLRNKGRSLAQQRGAWLRKAVDGAS
jgi:hypothetical protein